MTNPPTGTVTFLFTDIEGSTRRWDRQRQAMKPALARHDALLQAAIEAHGGHIFKTVGDAFHAAFANATDAIAAAVAAQRALHAEEWSAFGADFAELKVRVALHTGAAELRNGDYFGPPLNRTARLLSTGHGGQILLSLATEQLVRDELPTGAHLRDLGVHRLKDLSSNEHIFRLSVDDLPDILTPPDTAEELRPAERAHFDPELLPADCPYRGLHAFREADAPFFFGRETFTDLLANAIAAGPMCAVIGPSGSGKSSVVFAGLVPRLFEPNGNGRWLAVEMRPGNRPYHALAGALIPHFERDDLSETERLAETNRLAGYLREGTVAPRDVLARIGDKHPDVGHLLLVADQFEELYTLCPDDTEQRAFQDLLFTSAFEAGPLPMSLGLTLRADFMGHALAYRPFADAVQHHQVVLGPMNREELSRAVRLPAERQGRAFETGLVERIVDDVGERAGTLPLLEFALTKLWEHQTAGYLTHDAYEQIGRVEGAVARYADNVYERLSVEDQDRARRVFVQFVQPGEGTEDTRRIATHVELGVDWPLVQKLADSRLVVTNRDDAGLETAEVVHEALIRNWSRLKEWMHADRRFRSWQERLRFALRQWESADRDEGALFRGAPLAEAEGWMKERGAELSEAERGFVEMAVELRDRETRERQRTLEREAASARELRRRAVLLSAALVAAAGLALAAVISRQQATQNAERAEQAAQVAVARELAGASTVSLDIDAERATLLALAAVSATKRAGLATLPEVETALHRALSALHVERTIVGHRESVYASWSPVGDVIATNSSDGTASIWDAASGALRHKLDGQSDRVTTIAFSPDGSLLARAVVSDALQVWSVKSGSLVRTLVGQEDEIVNKVFSPDGRRIVTVSRDLTARVWDIGTGQTLWKVDVGGVFLGQRPFSADGRLLALIDAKDASQVTLWDMDAGHPKLNLTEPSSPVTVTRYSFSPDGTRIATASDDYAARIWDVATGKRIHLLSGPTRSTNALNFSPDNRLLAVASSDGTVRLWDVATGREVRFIQTGFITFTAVFSPDGRRLATTFSAGGLKVWDVNSGKETLNLVGHVGQVYVPSFSPDGRRLVTGGADSTVRIWNLEPSGEVPPISHGKSISWLALGRDGSRLLVDDGTAIRVFDTKTRSETLLMEGKTKSNLRPEISPDNRFFASWSPENSTVAALWNMQSGQLVMTYKGHSAPIARTSFSADGTYLATTSEDGTAKIWDALSGELIHTLTVSKNQLGSNTFDAEFSPNGQTIAVSHGDTTVQLWDVHKGVLTKEWEANTGTIQALDYSPDGSKLVTVSGDGTGRVWDLKSQTVIAKFVTEGSFREVEFSPDGMRLGTVDQSNQARIWDATTGAEIVTLYGHTQPVQDALFSPDGKRVYTASWDGTVRTFIMPLDELVTVASARLTRSLTPEECRRFLHVESCP